MQANDLAPLFQPLTVNTLTLPNRFIMPGMQRGMAKDGDPLPALGEYYCKRAKGGVALIISESCAINHPSSSQQPACVRMIPATLGSWGRIIKDIKAAGGNFFIQLWHEGAARREGGKGQYAAYPTLSPSGLIQANKPNGRAMTLEEMEVIKEAYVWTAQAAQDLGASGVEIHGAHGYLLDQFLWRETNVRTDGYGGEDIRARVRFPAEVAAAVRKAVGPKFPISFRFSQWKECDYTAKIVHTPAELGTMLGLLRAAGIDMFNVSTRRFYLPEWPGDDRGMAGWTKSLTDVPVVTVGSVGGLDIDFMANLIGEESKADIVPGLVELLRRFNNHEFDLAAVGRSLIGDPDWVRKVREGRFQDVCSFTRKDLVGGFEWDASMVEGEHAGH